jgi:hypothetical protein
VPATSQTQFQGTAVVASATTEPGTTPAAAGAQAAANKATAAYDSDKNGNKTEEEFAISLTGETNAPSSAEANDKSWQDHISAIVKDNCSTCHAAGKQSPQITDYATAKKVALKVSTALAFNRHPKDKLGDIDIDHLKSWAAELLKTGIDSISSTDSEDAKTADKTTSPASTLPKAADPATATSDTKPSELVTPASNQRNSAAATPCR